MKKMEDADYVLNDNQYVNDSLRGIVVKILGELEKEPNNNFLAVLAKELTYQRARLAMQNREVAKILPSVNREANVENAERATAVVIQDFQKVDEVISHIKTHPLESHEMLEEQLESN